MASNTNCFYPQFTQDFEFQLPTDAFINFDNVVFSDEVESNFQKASKKISKAGQEGSKKVNRKKHNRARNPWTPAEDLKLLELMKKHGQSWAMISAAMEGRTGKQIRDRYLNKLRPNIKCGDWSAAEDELMIRLLAEVGNRWSLIASHLPGRTEGQVKNRYYSSIKKRLESNGVFSQTSSASTVSETVSIPTSPQAEEPKFDFGFEFDTNMITFNPEPIMKSAHMVSKGPYALEDTYSDETTTQGLISQNESPYRVTDPTSVISYDFVSQSDFIVPTIDHDSQIDDILEKVTSYFLDNSPNAASDVDSFFSDDLKSPSSNETEKLALLARRKAYLELALAKTLKEMKSF